MNLTPDEYAAIGRRVKNRKHPKQPQGIGGQMGVLEPTVAERDRAALWEECNRLRALVAGEKYLCTACWEEFAEPTVESLGGTDD